MTTANIARSKIVPDSTRITPYYNQWDENDNYMTILFRPGYAVQATELTQIQSILQNQIERFGNHIFQNGTKILGGSMSIDTTAVHINLQTQYANTDISVGNFTNNLITYSSGNAYVQAYCIGAKSPTSNDSPVIVIKYLTGNEFAEGAVIKSKSNTWATIASANAIGNATTVSISEGIFYINGYFVKVPEQTIIVDKFTTQANARIGLEYSNEIIDASSDTSLLDPAQEASNYQAPGANRLKINFDLAVRSLDSEDDDNFVEFMRIENGTLKKQVVYTQYSALGDTLARRTYDESGNYTVRPFVLNILNHPTDDTKLLAVLDPGKAYVEGYEYESISQQTIEIPRARANSAIINNYDIPMNYGNYVVVGDLRGIFDFTSGAIADIHCVPYSSVNVSSNVTYTSTKIGTAHIRNLRYEGASNAANANTRTYRMSVFDTQFGNLTSNVVTASAQTLVAFEGTNVNKFSTVADAYKGGVLRIYTSTNGASSADRVIISGYNGTTKTFNTATAFATTPNANFQFSVDYDFSMAESFMIGANTPGSPSARSNANITVASKSDGTATGDAFLAESTLNSLVFPLPQNFIKPASITDQSFQYIKKMAVTFTAGSASATLTSYPDETFNGAGGSGTSSSVLNNFIVIPDAVNSIPLELISVSISLGVATITSTGSFSGAATVYAVVNINSGTNSQQKTKTLTTANTTHFVGGTANAIIVKGTTTSNVYLNAGQVVITNPSRVSETDMSLYVSDVKDIIKIYDLAGSSVPSNGSSIISYSDVTNKYIFDNGQRDSHYDHASIRLRSRVTAPKGPLIICFNWYEHTAGGDGTGYFDIDSYPNVANTSGYTSVPYFTRSDGATMSLRDCIDFRPKRQNATNTSPNYTVEKFRVPVPNENFQADYQYFLGRRDFLLLTRNQNDPFTLLQGESGVFPQWPRVMDGSMILYKIELDPYTLNVSNAVINFVENKRYTMRDIGRLETRIENLEYYNTLTLLEKAVSDLSILDSDGLERTKYGVLADNFGTFASGDIDNIDFSVSIDKNIGAILPRQITVERKLYPETLTNTKTLGEKTTLDFTEIEAITQTTATKWINIQPYMFADFIGTIIMDPPADNWIDTVELPDVIINTGSVNADLIADNTINQTRANTVNNAFTTVNNLPKTRFGTRESTNSNEKRGSSGQPSNRRS